MKPPKVPRPPKPRRLRAPLEPDLPEAGIGDDPRGVMHRMLKRELRYSLSESHSIPRHSIPHIRGMHTRADGAAPAVVSQDMERSKTTNAESVCAIDDSTDVATGYPRYAELHCLTNFSFQRGASSARELFDRAKAQGYAALAITDECSMSGIVRALEASDATRVKLIVGTEVQLADGPRLVLLATDQTGYSDICRLITTGRRCSAKGEYRLERKDAEGLGEQVLVLYAPNARSGSDSPEERESHAAWVSRCFGDRAWLAVELHRGADDAKLLADLQSLGTRHGLPRVAAGDVHMHVRRRRALQDVMTAIRLGCTVAEAGNALFPNGERHLRKIEDLDALHPPELIAESLRIAALCTFDLHGINYVYPHELVPEGLDASTHLKQLTRKGAATRYPQGVPVKVAEVLDKELALIRKLKYEAFFLTVHDIVQWARNERGILCQGRGSSANSAVCYCLGITAVKPDEGHLLFERFLSEERNEPPDIDVDFEHERREEVIQYVFDKYGRERAALAATVISYRGKSAVRDVGHALGIPDDQIDNLTGMFSRVRSDRPLEEWLRERGFDPSSRILHRLFRLANEIRGFPRHLSQHVGGFVISEHALHHLVPVENASMPDRTIIQWDKDDLETMKLLKVDCLALGMLTCISKCFRLLHEHHGIPHELASIPRNDAETFEMIRAADTVGVFQIESRAQMSMLPRLKPREFYDLVIQVAIVRPGPIQGGMVHPYLKRRHDPASVVYESQGIRDVLERTLGVPIFQEQVMELLKVTADFTPGEADQLRRSMAAWKRRGGLEQFRDRIFEGMKKNNYTEEFAERIYQQIQGFGEYGFPESHSYSFALLAYASSWLKRHHPAVFTCALLNAQPMGFYQPSQLIQDARNHRVDVRPVDVTISAWDCTLEPVAKDDNPAAVGTPTISPPEPTSNKTDLSLRLGLRQIRGLSQDLADRLVGARGATPFADVADMTRRARVTASERGILADAGALQSLSGHRYRARWESAGAELPAPILATATMREDAVALRKPSLREDVMTDYRTLGLSLTGHPLELVRDELLRRRVSPACSTLDAANHGRTLRCAGLVTVRQHPGTAKGVTFVTLEDETGQVNVVVWRALAQKQHRVLLESTVMAVDGVLEASDGVRHLIAKRLHDFSALLPEFSFASRDFH
ncbi:MAG: error-prone DNA polymerase [Dokdonella sp.]|uniref:error-prone DNA polymerase n=1 Tax=Dokdonella sp. TaxID=2291710 RepID=UPI003264E7A7